MREEKVGLISPQEVKKRALDRTFRPTSSGWKVLGKCTPECARAVVFTQQSNSSPSWVELASTGGSVGLNTFCYLNLFLVFSSVCGTAARVMHGALFVYCRSFLCVERLIGKMSAGYS